MRAVVQRVTDADVSVENKITGAVGKGYVVLLGVEEGDSEADAEYMAEKITGQQYIFRSKTYLLLPIIYMRHFLPV